MSTTMATESSNTTATSSFSASFSTVPMVSLSGPNVSHFLKLTKTNYLLWKRQMEPFLHGHDFMKYVEDTGATHHMTVNADALQNRVPHTGNSSILLGNGDKLDISQTGNIPITLGSNKFQLNNVYHVPSMRKNLFSVAKFTADNFVRVSFDPYNFHISDLHSGVPLFQGQCRDGLYPLSVYLPPPAPSAFSSQL
ncbi:hypothetical protein GIB67_032115 [Kingdonia uniflora]|uniref:Retrovirus-related Pol polyprotein from transposon TNT 1-94-like beta-barrel domain-containing protein n=1 Tax=Kingdonia uniflora TaxID=39325 RepID=A0A7J7MX23_9MAGN|nr:hypothetical protein GIB67_032115 [Kingdonia uniflora]